MTALGFLVAFIATMVLPTLSARWAALRGIARTALALTGIKVNVTGLENLPRGNAVILFNHTSYMDAVIIASVLPGEPAFVAKKEFAEPALRRQLHAPARRRVRRALRCRREPRGRRQAVTGMAKEGRLFVFFPEGTFTRRAGLLGFYMGAFKVAAEAEPAGRAGHPARRAHAVARRSVVPAPHADQRRDRAADPAGRHRLHRHAGAARCGARRDAQACRRAGSGRAGEAAGARYLMKFVIRCQIVTVVTAVLSACAAGRLRRPHALIIASDLR